MSVTLIYKDVAPYAKRDSTLAAEDKQAFVDLGELKNDGLRAANYATLEQDFWFLDGSFESFPDQPRDMGWYSESMSGPDGRFAEPIVLTRTFSKKHTAVGVTFTFDRYNNDYCNSLNVKWYADDTLLYDVDFSPDSAKYFCAKNVELFNKMIVTFYSMNTPYRYLKVAGIDDGTLREFTDSNLRGVNVLEELSPVSDELSINTLNFDLDSDDTDYIFQKKQPIDVYHNDVFLGIYYVENSERITKSQYSVACEDMTGLLDKVDFLGGIYTQATVQEIVDDIMLGEFLDYEIDPVVAGKVLSGYLPICTKRAALALVAFACGAVVDASRSRAIRIFQLEQGEAVDIAPSNIFAGGSIETGDIITGVELTEHEYTESKNDMSLFKGTVPAGRQLITFSEPAFGLVYSGGTLVEMGSNYIILETSGGNVRVDGYKYDHSTRVISKVNEDIPFGTQSNLIKVPNATLVTSGNSAELLNAVYAYYIIHKTMTCQLVADGLRVGQRVKIQTEWSGKKTGILQSLNLDLKNKLIGEAVVKIG